MTATLDTSSLQTGRRTPVHPAAELLHDARAQERAARISDAIASYEAAIAAAEGAGEPARSEEHTSELQSQSNLVCRLLLEKKKHREHTPRFSFGQIRKSSCTPLFRDSADLADPPPRRFRRSTRF